MRIAITGAGGRLGSIIRTHLAGMDEHELVLLDRDDRGDPAIEVVDLAGDDTTWTKRLAGVDIVLHLAGDPRVDGLWRDYATDNVDATLNLFRAAAERKVKRVIYTSSLRTMEGYRYGAKPIAADWPPRPVTFYAISKLAGEAIGRGFSKSHGMSVICLRLGLAQAGTPPPGRRTTPWIRARWLSEKDFCQAIDKAIAVEGLAFAILPVVSDNETKIWDLSETRSKLGYEPEKGTTVEPPSLVTKARAALGWLFRRYVDPRWKGYWR